MTGMFGSQKPAPIPTPIVMPQENTAAITAAKQAELMAASARSGRASTIMSSNDISKTDTMGG